MLLLTAEPKLLVVVVLLAVCGDVRPVSEVGVRSVAVAHAVLGG